jgi:hypothetical protein
MEVYSAFIFPYLLVSIKTDSNISIEYKSLSSSWILDFKIYPYTIRI